MSGLSRALVALAVAGFVLGLAARANAVVLIALIQGPKYYQQATTPSPTGRDATIRTRFFAWGYAMDLLVQKPFLGHGQGGYALLADGLAATSHDAETDPQALDGRIVADRAADHR